MPRNVALTWEMPARSTEYVPTREDIAHTLKTRSNEWAIVARPDRWERAESIAKRIAEGREYGGGFETTISKVGAEIRVYARYVGE